MSDAGFFKGTSTDQDLRFKDKEKALLRGIKFPAELDKKVDMRKVELSVMRPWIAQKIIELLGFEDEVVIEYVNGLLEDESNPVVDPKKMQLNLTGFLTTKTGTFMTELWTLLLSAQSSPLKVPAVFIEQKKEEMRKREEEDKKAAAENRRRQEFEQGRERQLADIRERERGERGGGRGRGGFRGGYDGPRDGGWGGGRGRGRGRGGGPGGYYRDRSPPRRDSYGYGRDRSPPARRRRSPSYSRSPSRDSRSRSRSRSPPRRRRRSPSLGSKGGLGKYTRRRAWTRRAIIIETLERIPLSALSSTPPNLNTKTASVEAAARGTQAVGGEDKARATALEEETEKKVTKRLQSAGYDHEEIQ